MAANAVARETLFALRETIAKIEGRPAAILQPAWAGDVSVTGGEPVLSLRHNADKACGPLVPFGIEVLDEALEGGLPVNGLTEIRTEGFRDAAAAGGFTLGLAAMVHNSNDRPGPVLWIGDRFSTFEAGCPYAPGVDAFGVEIERFLYARPRRLEEALWLAEAALSSAAFAAIILEMRGNPARFGLTQSRRLHLRAKAAGRPLFILREGAGEEASSAIFRFSVTSSPAVMRRLPDGSKLNGSIGHPVFRVLLEKSRNPAPLSLFLEWNPHDRQFIAHATNTSFIQTPYHARTSAHSGAQLSLSCDRQDRAQEMGVVLALERAS